jgi:hypothetical protein
MPQRGAPLATYSTATGDFRLDEDEARRRGLIPDGDRLPAKVARRLRTEAGLTTEQVTKAAADYGKLGDAKRGELLEAVAMARPRNLRAVAGDVFKSFDPDAEVEAEGADTASPRPAARARPAPRRPSSSRPSSPARPASP